MAWIIHYKDSTGRHHELAPLKSELAAMRHAQELSQQRGGCQIVEVRNSCGFVIKAERLPALWKELLFA